MTTRSGLITLAGLGRATARSVSAGGAGGASEKPAGDPKAAVISAFHTVGESDGVSLRASLDSSPEDLKKVNAAQPDAQQLSPDDLRAASVLLDGAVTTTLSARDRSTLAQGGNAYAVSAQLSGRPVIDVVAKDGVFYLKTDAKTLLGKFGFQVSDARRDLITGADPVIATPGNALLDGKWVSVDLARSGLLENLGATVPDPAQQQKVLSSFEAAFETKAEVTAGEDGSYHVVAPAQQIAEAVQDDLVALAGKDLAGDVRQQIKDIPSGDVTFDVFLQDGKLDRINLDLVQFLDNPVKDAKLTLTLDVDPDPQPVRAPGGAVEIDLPKVLDILGFNQG